jgi:hypothetical protein
MHAVCGYDVRTEVFGERGTIEIGGLQRRNIMLAAEGSGAAQPCGKPSRGSVRDSRSFYGAAILYLNERTSVCCYR